MATGWLQELGGVSRIHGTQTLYLLTCIDSCLGLELPWRGRWQGRGQQLFKPAVSCDVKLKSFLNKIRIRRWRRVLLQACNDKEPVDEEVGD